MATTAIASYRISVPLSGVDIQAPDGTPLEWENVTVRRLSEVEQGDHFEQTGASSLMALLNAPPLVVLECNEEYRRNEQMPLALPRRVRLERWNIDQPKFIHDLALHGSLLEWRAPTTRTPYSTSPSPWNRCYCPTTPTLGIANSVTASASMARTT
ncbi:hypothetical protein ABZ379_01155 [Streptomyces canus]|uniref:hypothetical protein n=1 Tax=Streptomyces canus TaxID=58343 RepID=UPI0033F8FC27